jgi:excinuclease ABC subunit A
VGGVVPLNGSSSPPPSPPAPLPKGEGSVRGHITLRGVRVHNLKSIDLDIPRRELIVFCGLSGSGKSSLALDTLYAEGQRRYIESFSAYTRQFLQRLERPEAERIDGIPPAIAVTGKNTSRSSRSTVGTATETNDYLRLLFAKIGHTFCRQCGREVRCDSPQSAAETLTALPAGTRYMISFACPVPNDETIEQVRAALREDGFVRAIVDGRLANLDARGDGRRSKHVGNAPGGGPASVELATIVIAGDELGVDWSAPATRATMLPKLLQIYQGKQYTNRELNVPIIVGKRGIKKVLSHLPDAKPAMAMAKLPELLELAAWDRDEAPRKPDQNIRMWHYLKVAVVLGGQHHVAEIKIREDGNGHWFYDQHLVLQKKEGPPYKPGTSASGSTSAGEPSHIQIIGRSDQEVKRKKRNSGANGYPEEVDGVSLSGAAYVIVDRLAAGSASDSRLRDSLETAFAKGRGRCYVLVEDSAVEESGSTSSMGTSLLIDGKAWRRIGFGSQLACEDCGIEYPAPEPRLYSFNSPLGACPECEGFGNVIGLDMELIVPDPGKSLREGAIAPWTTPAYAHELKELLALARDYDIPTDAPFRQLTEQQVGRIVQGVPERKFGGLEGFFAWLERRKYKMHIRVFLSRWRSFRICPSCGGTRLRPEALAARVGGRNIGELGAMKVRDAAAFFRRLELPDYELQVGRMMLEQVQARLGYLEAVGLGYLTLDRTLRTLSGGEARRVALTSALGSSLVGMLYVLDEPSIGLHPRDINQLLGAIRKLRERGNTVVVVEHEEAIIRAADQVIEIGPGAGERGGKVVFQGTPGEMERSPDSLTGDYLAGRRGFGSNGRRREPNHGWVRLAGARGNNLKKITVEFPMGVLCMVTGVSGSGKSTLVQDTLYPALCRRLRKDAPKPEPHDDVFGDGQLDDVIMVDQSPIGRSPRSNPVTYLKAFDEIRAVFADTVEARTRGFDAGHFSFNVDGGRCSNCQGDGYLQIDMQFLADVYMRCPQCNGARYRDEILDVTYRGRNIADVLEMTVREAFTFFRGQPKVQARLKKLIDVGLDYVRLGQPANTLSGGEAQRLKLASYMSTAKRGRCLFILDEPTTGLHFSDVVQLLDCFDALLAVGHSLLVVEHNLQIMRAADYIIDLGPGAADEGGQVVAKGTPEQVARTAGSVTAGFLAKVLKEREVVET